MADRFYCPDAPSGGGYFLEGDEARHLARVRRVGPGETVELFDGRGLAVTARVETVARDRVELAAVGDPRAEAPAQCRLTLATAVPKGERFDWLVEKATELGVERLVPLVTERSVVDPGAAKLARLRRAVIEACKQCGRNRLMELDPPTPWTTMAARHDDGLRFLAQPGGAVPSSWPRTGSNGKATLAVGPEGGFTDEEARVGDLAGWTIVSLGRTLLRIETAGLAGCSAILALCKGWDE